MKSLMQEGGRVPFPAHLSERVYQLPFRKADGLPAHLKRWQMTIDAMLSGVDAPGWIYLMVDQSDVAPGSTTRRPGVHVDMIWDGGKHAHGTRGYQGIILAADRVGCAVHLGDFTGAGIGAGGEVTPHGLEQVVLRAGVAYAGDSMQMVHESLPLLTGGKRTVVRLSVDGWTPFRGVAS